MGPNDVADAYLVSILAGADAKYVRLFRLYLFPIQANRLVISRIPALLRVSTRKPNIAGAMRITPEGTLGTWYVKTRPISLHERRAHIPLITFTGRATVHTNARKATAVPPLVSQSHPSPPSPTNMSTSAWADLFHSPSASPRTSPGSISRASTPVCPRIIRNRECS